MLLDEHPIIVLPSLAKKVGLNESIVSQQLHYWLNDITKSEKKSHYRDGFYWVWNTYEEWHKQFPWWSVRTIRRILEALEESKLVVTANYNKMPMDKTKWYRIDYEVLRQITGEAKELEHPELQSVQNGQSENKGVEGDQPVEPNEPGVDKMASPCGQNGQSMWTSWPDPCGQVGHSNNQRLHIEFNTETTPSNATGVAETIVYQPQEQKFEDQTTPGVEEKKTTPKSKRKSKAMPGHFPEEFDRWWLGYYDFCLEVDHSPGKRGEAAVTWDEIFEGNPELLMSFLEGDAWYVQIKKQQFVAKGEAVGVSHGFRYLRDLKWQEALDHKRKKSANDPYLTTSAIHPDWLTNPDDRFIQWLCTTFLPKKPENRGIVLADEDARAWLSDAKHTPKRFDQAKIAWEGFSGGSGTNLASVRNSIASELRRLGMNGALPASWMERTGATTPAELGLEDAIAYLNYLKGLNHVETA
jgi:hypothetical protein